MPDHANADDTRPQTVRFPTPEEFLARFDALEARVSALTEAVNAHARHVHGAGAQVLK